MQSWTIQEAKSRFCEVIDRANSTHQPQKGTRNGKDMAVIIAYSDYLKLCQTRAAEGQSLLERLMPDDPIGVELEIERQRDCGRSVNL